MLKCIAPGCKSGYESQIREPKDPEYEKINFFSIPEDLSIKALWEKALIRKNFTLKGGQFVCSKHFLKEDIVHKKILKASDCSTLRNVSNIFTVE